MKKTLICAPSLVIPNELFSFIEGARVYDSSSSPEAKVYYIDKDSGYFLKFAKPGALKKEAEIGSYFHSLSLGAEVLHYSTFEGSDVFMTARLAGEDCTHEEYLSDPKRLCEIIATELRRLHETDYKNCPVMNRTADYIRTVDDNYHAGICDLSYSNCKSKDEAYRTFCEYKNALKCDTLLHGDYCLPNIILKDWNLSGFIDLGAGGVGDRHIDLFWGAWTLNFNLHTDKYRERFADVGLYENEIFHGVAEMLEKLSVDTCMLCGCCSFICPANRPLVQTNKLAKQFLKEEKAKEAQKNG